MTDLEEFIYQKVGEASTLFISDDGKRLDGVFDTKRADKIAQEIIDRISNEARRKT